MRASRSSGSLGKSASTPSVLGGLLLVLGGATMGGYLYHTHPPFRDLVNRDLGGPLGRAGRQGAVWIRDVGRETSRGVAWIEDAL